MLINCKYFSRASIFLYNVWKNADLYDIITKAVLSVHILDVYLTAINKMIKKINNIFGGKQK
jgi:hypothetical protein